MPPRFDHAPPGACAEDRLHAATFELVSNRPQASAYRLFSPRGKAAVIATLVVVASFALWSPASAAVVFNVALYAFVLISAAARIAFAAIGIAKRQASPPPAPTFAIMPTFTILLPLFREASSLSRLAAAIGRLDYPTAKLDVKLLLEAEDAETIAAARALGLDAKWDVIVVPKAAPQTKPKACNYGIAAARGALLVIYDAEDDPEPDQLRKAAAAFATAPPEVACLQARLAYYNARENWLTRLFALEYCLWFDAFLPGLQRLDLPIPLGGTSNIFRTEILRAIGGWDPFNVTEDADVGLRLARRGWRTELLDSTTWEEANCRVGNWLRQRSRWIKGYVQTWIVHIRRGDPDSGRPSLRGLIATHLFVGGTVVSALLNPGLSIVATARFFGFVPVGGPDAHASALFGASSALFSGLLLAGLFAQFALFLIAAFRRGLGGLAPWALLAPVYAVLTSIAAWKALLQLFTRPHYWEKTEHMISAFSPEYEQSRLATGDAARHFES